MSDTEKISNGDKVFLFGFVILCFYFGFKMWNTRIMLKHGESNIRIKNKQTQEQLAGLHPILRRAAAR